MKRKLSYLMMAPAFALTSGMTMAAGPALEEIFVTATKTESTAMETPLSLEAFTGANLKESGLNNLQDISALVPSVNIGDGQITGSINIRGMGSGTDRSFEQSVAMFIDGIYMPRSRQYRAPFFDMERVEILRGPQSMLYGLNATAGTINITTATTLPDDETSVSLTGEYETEYGGTVTSVVAGGTVADTLGVRLAVRYTDDDEGFYDNTTTGEDEGAEEETIVRLSLAWQASDDLMLTTKINWADAEMDGSVGEGFGFDTVALGGDGKLDWKRQTGSLELLSQITDEKAGYDQELLSVSVNATYLLGENEIVAVVGYSEADFEQRFDVAQIAVPFFAAQYREEFEQINAEVRFVSDQDQIFSYIAGLYLGDSENFNLIASGFSVDGLLSNVFGFPVGAPALVEQTGNTSETTTISPFFSGTYNFSDTVRLIAGGRYSHEEKNSTRYVQGFSGEGIESSCLILSYDLPTDTHTPVVSVPGCLTNFPGKQDEITAENFMPEAILQWDANEDSVAYAKLGKSVKSGGHTFSNSVPDASSLTYDDEIAKTFEIGYKTMIMDNRLQLNAAVYITQYEDLQVSSFVPDPGGAPTSTITNAGESEAKGVEVEVDFAALEWLTVGGSVAYLDHKYEKYDAGACAFGTAPDFDSNGDGTPNACNHTGKTTPFSPLWSGAVYADVELPITDTILFKGGINVAYSEDHYAEGTLSEEVKMPHYSRIDARFGIADADDKWSISVIGKNLESTPIIASSQPFGVIPGTGFGMGYIGDPKTIAIQGTYNF